MPRIWKSGWSSTARSCIDTELGVMLVKRSIDGSSAGDPVWFNRGPRPQWPGTRLCWRKSLLNAVKFPLSNRQAFDRPGLFIAGTHGARIDARAVRVHEPTG